MFSYRHSFHIGNHANVLRHTVQDLVIESLKEKDKPFLYLGTHAETGRYQLSSKHAERAGEYLRDITHIWQQNDLSAELEVYINMVKHLSRSGQLRYYPGSPLTACQLLCERNNLQLTELRPNDYPLLRSEFQKGSRARVEKADGFQQPKAKLPPVSYRDLILIDPPYETRADYQAVVGGIAEGYKHFTTGTYTLWYPVVLRQQIRHTIHDLGATGIRKVLQIELAVLPDSDRRGMAASGIVVINPLWKLEQQMNNMLSWLHSKLAPAGTGYTTVNWIVPE